MTGLRTEILRLYDECIKTAMTTIIVLKNGNYVYKQSEIAACKKDIKFFKEMKEKIYNGFFEKKGID